MLRPYIADPMTWRLQRRATRATPDCFWHIFHSHFGER